MRHKLPLDLYLYKPIFSCKLPIFSIVNCVNRGEQHNVPGYETINGTFPKRLCCYCEQMYRVHSLIRWMQPPTLATLKADRGLHLLRISLDTRLPFRPPEHICLRLRREAVYPGVRVNCSYQVKCSNQIIINFISWCILKYTGC